MSKIIMMCGIPGSGKSTFCHKHFQDYIYISRDQIRFSLLNDSDSYFAKEDEVMKKFLEKINFCVQQGNDFVIDATHLTKSSRRKILSQLTLSPLYPVSDIYCIYMKTDLKLALERNNKRTGRKLVPEKVIKNMYANLEEPELDEGFEKIITIEER